MKGYFKRKKGHFSKGYVHPNKGKKLKNDSFGNTVKRTYIRLSKKTLDKVVDVPKSVQQYATLDSKIQSSDTPVLLRSPQEVANSQSGNTNDENDAR